MPRAALCLLTALRLHGLTTQNPFDVWIMIDRKARKPSIDYPPIRIVRASGSALSDGIETFVADGVDVCERRLKSAGAGRFEKPTPDARARSSRDSRVAHQPENRCRSAIDRAILFEEVLHGYLDCPNCGGAIRLIALHQSLGRFGRS